MSSKKSNRYQVIVPALDALIGEPGLLLTPDRKLIGYVFLNDMSNRLTFFATNTVAEVKPLKSY
ncbi:MAG: hypothetical protein Q3996_03060 [Candidatus Saccharibacteria bacterium]|nr:hypothetical protein [Candidatus Saccharibacteria bacterium]